MRNSVKITWIAGISTIIAALITALSFFLKDTELSKGDGNINLENNTNSTIILGDDNEFNN